MDETACSQVECPICSLMFNQDVIETHADACVLGLKEKPVTRNKNKSPNVFFGSKTTKRNKNNEEIASLRTKKKIKFEPDIKTKEGSENSKCSKEFTSISDNEVTAKQIDELAVKKETTEGKDLEDLASQQSSKMSSFFAKKTIKQRKKELRQSKENVPISQTSIDLTSDTENSSNPDGKVDAVQSEDNRGGNSDEHVTNSPVLRNNVNMNTLFPPHTCVNLDFKGSDDDKVKIPAPPVVSFEDNSEIENTVPSTPPTKPVARLNTCQDRSPSKENNLSEIKGKQAFPPPQTAFQQELLNMSIESGSLPPSPPVLSNFRYVDPHHSSKEKEVESTRQNSLSSKVKGNMNDLVQQKKGNEVVLGKLPLSEQMRPKTLDNYIGQINVGMQKLLKELFYNDRIPSLILWGPPGCGKTSLAHIISQQCKAGQRYRYVSLSATMSGVNDVKEAVKIAKNEKRLRQKHTVLFIDEVHRFNKAQQDSFLPHIEDGTIVFIGATTENPSFHLNNALISRCRIIALNSLSVESVMKILRNAVVKLGGAEGETNHDENGDYRFVLENGLVKLFAENSNGDARIALTSLDMLLQAKLNPNSDAEENKAIPTITCEQVKEELKRGHVNYDRKGDEHYDIISAFHKSIRGSDQDAAIYWLARMLEGGEEPLYIARRLIVIASEDIGMADSNGLNLAVSCYQACQFIGMPECSINLAHVTTYLANAPKSIASYSAYSKAKLVVKEHSGPQPNVPLHLRNAPTKLMRDMGFSKGYKYPPDYENGVVEQDYLPKELIGTKFFT